MGVDDHRRRIFDEIDEERIRQDTKWGELNHPDVDTVLTDRDGGCTTQRMAEEYGIPTATCARANCDGEAKLGRCTWAHIAVEELAEAVEAATDAQQGRAPVASLRKELVQLTAVLVAWVEAIDRRPKDGSRMRNMVSAVEVAGSSSSSGPKTCGCSSSPRCAMRERPILFSGPMVRAILAGEKTVTRRMINVTGASDVGDVPGHPEELMLFGVGQVHAGANTRSKLVTCPYGRAGDRLWVRETWLPHEHDDHADIATYRADHADGPVPEKVQQYREVRGRWKSGRFMPRIASRITLEVVSVRAERLHAIDDADALREGVKHYDPVHLWDVPEPPFSPPFSPREVFQHLWDSINGERAPWSSNPFVWRIEFRRMEVRHA